MAKVTLDLQANDITAALALLYSAGFNDGLRRALGKPLEGQNASVAMVRGFLKDLSTPVAASNGK